MKNCKAQIEQIISTYAPQLKQISEKDFSEKPDPDRWSRKEELGHLIDSAHNNLRRFIVTQYESNPNIVYDQNFWNSSNCYQQQPIQDLIELWILLNKQIGYVLNAATVEQQQRLCDTGKQKSELHTIQWLAEDYLTHLRHHLHHLLNLEPIAYS